VNVFVYKPVRISDSLIVHFLCVSYSSSSDVALLLTDNTLQIRSQAFVQCNFICIPSIKMKCFFGRDILKLFMRGIPLCALLYIETDCCLQNCCVNNNLCVYIETILVVVSNHKF
jgi:hypothetical protein